LDSTREHLWGQLLLERNLVAQPDLMRLVQERDQRLRGGQDCSLGELLIHHRRIDPRGHAQLQQEIEGRGRACFQCRQVFLARVGDPPTCPGCGGMATLPPPQQHASGRFPAQGLGRFPAQALQSGRFPAGGRGNPHGSYAGSPHGSYAGNPHGSYAGNPQAAGPHGSYAGRAPAYGDPNASYQPGMSGRFARPIGYPTVTPPPGSGRFQHPHATPPPSSHRMPAVGGDFNPVAEPQPGADHLAPSLASIRWNGGQVPGSTAPADEISIDDSGSDFGVGKTFGGYEILDEVGRGGMGVVYKVRSPGRPGVLALKVLLAGEFASPKLMQRFRDEAKLASRLRHPNIVAVHDVGEVDGIPYYAMDFVPGSELQDLIRQKNLSVRRGVEVLVDVAKAAHHAHGEGVIHRDLKPSNVLVAETGTPYIMDFGLAKNLESDKGLTRSGVAIGTPYYMPPEQARGSHREMDARSDVYALGAMLYEVLTRRVPFTAKTQNELLRKIIEEEPTPPRQLRASVPQPLETICLKALQKGKDDRYESALALAQDLERFLAGRPIQARPLPPWVRAWRKARKNKTVTLAVGGVILASAIAATVVAAIADDLEQESRDKIDRLEQEDQAEEQRREEEQRRLEERRQREQELAALRADADRELNRGLEAFAASRSAVSLVAAREALERADRLLSTAVEVEQRLPDGTRATTAYRRGLIRRSLCRWDEAAEDFATAGEDPALQARANLARGLVLLRAFEDRQGALEVLTHAVASATANDSAVEERTAEDIARAYRAFLDGDVPTARRRLGDVLDRAGGIGALAVEANGGLAYFSRRAGAPLGGDDHARAGLPRADLAVSADRYRYEFLVDRAVLRARAGQLDEALRDLRTAQALDADGEEPDLAKAVVHVRRGQGRLAEQAMSEARRKARSRGPAVTQRVDAFDERLKRAIRDGDAPPPPVAPSPTPTPQPPRPDDSSNVLRDDYSGVIRFNPSRSNIKSQVQVGPDVTAVKLYVGDVEKTIGIYVRHGQPLRSLDQADRQATGPGDASLVLHREGGTLRTGTYHVVVIYPQRPTGTVAGTFTAEFYRGGERPPHAWSTLADDGGVSLRPENGPKVEAAARRFATGSTPQAKAEAIEDLKEVEALEPENTMLKTVRVRWMIELGRLDEAAEVLQQLHADHPGDPHVTYLLGRVHLERDEPERTIELLREILADHPDYLDVRYVVAELLTQTGRHEEALAAAKEILELDPLEHRAAGLAGQAQLALGQTDAGAATIEAVVTRVETPLRSSFLALKALLEAGEAAKVIELVDAVRKLREGVSGIPFDFELLRCEALAASGQRAEALRQLEALKSKVVDSDARIAIEQAISELR